MTRYYRVYGLSLKSAIPLPCPAHAHATHAVSEMAMGSSSVFEEAREKAGVIVDETQWFKYAPLPDGSVYLRWSGLFEFLVSAGGRRIACRALNGTSREAFQTYLVSHVLSFALLQQGIESLHATAVVVNGQAVGFLGDSGYGKSSLGAACLRAGHRLLTDDVLVATKKNGHFLAHPGPSRIKLFPHIAEALLGDLPAGPPMNPHTPKLVIPLPAHLHSGAAAPLRTLYVLQPPNGRSRRVAITPLPRRRACLALIANTFNPVIMERERLARQFDWAARLAAAVPVKLLSHPDDPARLPAVVEAIQADLIP